MSVEIDMIEFEKREAHLSSELEDGPPYTVHGVALGEGDVTRGASGIEKYWPAEELEKAAETLRGRNLVEDHNNDSRGVVGEVMKAGYKEGVGVLYEAELDDKELAKKVRNGRLEVSIRGYHKDVDEMEETEEGAKIVEDIQFDNLSIVPSGASPSNTLEMGPAEELSVAALSEHVSALQEDEEDDEVEAGDYVQWDDSRGIVLTMPENGEVDVDVYEESDGEWRAVGTVETVAVDDLSSWDVDDEDIGAADEEDDSEEEDEESDEDVEDDEAENAPAEDFLFDSEEEALDFIEDKDGLTGVHEMDEGWMPGDDHAEFEEWHDEQHSDDEESENAKHGDEDTEKMDPDVEDDKESEAAKNYHRSTLDKLEDFLTAEVNDTTTSVGDFVEWADNESVQQAVEEFTSIEGFSGSSNVGDLQRWLKNVIGVEEEENAEGEEDPITSDVERAESADESRNPDGAFDDEYEEAGEEVPDDSVEESADEGSEESDVEELQEWEFHEPSWDGTTESDWSSPDMEDFDTDDLGEIADHFLISQTGFPPENFTDLALPVVEPNGDLNVNALAAVKGGRGTSAVEGLSDDMGERIDEYVNNLANEHFDRDWGMEEASITGSDTPTDSATPTHKMDPEVEDDKETEQTDPVSCALELINYFLRENARDERDSVDKMLSWLFSSTDVPTKKMEAFRTAANAFLDQQGGADSFSAVDVESFRDWLLTQGGQTDDGVHARSEGEPTAGSGLPRIATPVHVLTGDDLRSNGASKEDDNLNTIEVLQHMTNIEEELEELDEPVAVEKNDLEELQEKADRMDEMSETLASLKERTDVLDSVDADKVEQLEEADDAVVIESDEYESLSEEAEQVKSLYAEQLAEDSPFSAEDFVDKFSIDELREKYEAAGGDLEEELSAEPKSGDVEEEELEERAEEENESEEELEKSEEIESKQAELRDKILGN